MARSDSNSDQVNKTLSFNKSSFVGKLSNSTHSKGGSVERGTLLPSHETIQELVAEEEKGDRPSENLLLKPCSIKELEQAIA